MPSPVNKKERKNMTKKKNLCLAILFTVLFLIFTLLVCTVDVQPIGLEGTSVGFATINGRTHTVLGDSDDWYLVTEYLGYVAIAEASTFVICGLIQWIRRKDLRKVDRDVLALGWMFLIVVVLYFFFDKLPISYRPMIPPDETVLETSFPSSHTMLALSVFGATLIILRDKVTDRTLRTVLTVLFFVLIASMIIGRLLSGAHWLTDIIAGIILGTSLLLWFNLGRKDKTE